jgi:hypothetical protein
MAKFNGLVIHLEMGVNTKRIEKLEAEGMDGEDSVQAQVAV